MARQLTMKPLKVKDCMSCPFRKNHYGMGECWDYCSHPDAPGTYKNIIVGCNEKFRRVPKWCPGKEVA